MNILRLTILINIIILYCSFNTNDYKYRVSDIPKELLKNAKAVVRSEEMIFSIKSSNKAFMKVNSAITIMNKNGKSNSYLTVFYNKFRKVKKLKGTVYDKNGVIVKRIKNDQKFDFSAGSGFSLYDDNRVKVIDPEYLNYPYTIEYSYEIEFSDIVSFPTWSPQKAYNISVQESSFKIETSKNHSFHYFQRNLKIEPSIKLEGNRKEYIWEIKNEKALKEEPFSRSFEGVAPQLILSPSNFEAAGYKGNCDSWGNFGKWISKLNKNRDHLNNDFKTELVEMTKNAKNDIEKVKILYEYLQNKTRYVSIQIGIGGWQPFKAEVVNDKSYGDCKALTNYMGAMLSAIGLKSNYVLVKAGPDKEDIIIEFPSNQFNHAILCVPIMKDTIWLECTSQQNPFGYLGTFTDNRNVLIIDENGAKIAKTKKYTIDDNQLIRKTNFALNPNGKNKVIINTIHKGVFYDKLNRILRLKGDKKKLEIIKSITLAKFKLNSYDYIENKLIVPNVKELLVLDVQAYCTKIKNKIIFPLNQINRIKKLPYNLSSRNTDIIIKRSSSTIDSIYYTIPSNYKNGKLPVGDQIISKFGNYSSNTINLGDSILYVRKLDLYNGVYPKNEYKEFVEFFSKINIADKKKIALSKSIN